MRADLLWVLTAARSAGAAVLMLAFLARRPPAEPAPPSGELDRAQEIEFELGTKLVQIEMLLERERPIPAEGRDAQTQAAKPA